MVTYFNRKDLVAFGNYLLSKKRTRAILEHPEFKKTDPKIRLEQVSHADVENFLESIKKVE